MANNQGGRYCLSFWISFFVLEMSTQGTWNIYGETSFLMRVTLSQPEPPHEVPVSLRTLLLPPSLLSEGTQSRLQELIHCGHQSLTSMNAVGQRFYLRSILCNGIITFPALQRYTARVCI